MNLPCSHWSLNNDQDWQAMCRHPSHTQACRGQSCKLPVQTNATIHKQQWEAVALQWRSKQSLCSRLHDHMMMVSFPKTNPNADCDWLTNGRGCNFIFIMLRDGWRAVAAGQTKSPGILHCEQQICFAVHIIWEGSQQCVQLNSDRLSNHRLEIWVLHTDSDVVFATKAHKRSWTML